MIVELTTQFSCAHLYQNPNFSNEENHKHFGKCFSQFGHGHDYRLLVQFEIAQIADLNELTQKFQITLDQLSNHLDHHHLNFIIEYFKTHIPTTENLAQYCLDFLRTQNPTAKIKKVTLFERSDLWVEISN